MYWVKGATPNPGPLWKQGDSFIPSLLPGELESWQPESWVGRYIVGCDARTPAKVVWQETSRLT